MPQTAYNDKHHRTILQSIAHRAMLERGLLPDFSTAVLAELDRELESSSIRLSQALPRKAPGSGFSAYRLKVNWCRGLAV